VQPLVHHFETEPPFNRVPLYEAVSGLAAESDPSRTEQNWRDVRLVDLHPASWYPPLPSSLPPHATSSFAVSLNYTSTRLWTPPPPSTHTHRPSPESGHQIQASISNSFGNHFLAFKSAVNLDFLTSPYLMFTQKHDPGSICSDCSMKRPATFTNCSTLQYSIHRGEAKCLGFRFYVLLTAILCLNVTMCMGNNSCVADFDLRLKASLCLIALRLKACILYL